MIRSAEQTRERQHAKWVVSVQERHAKRFKELQQLLDDAPTEARYVTIWLSDLMGDTCDFQKYLSLMGYHVETTGQYSEREQLYAIRVWWAK